MSNYAKPYDNYFTVGCRWIINLTLKYDKIQSGNIYIYIKPYLACIKVIKYMINSMIWSNILIIIIQHKRQVSESL
jgi:hypothetical protein